MQELDLKAMTDDELLSYANDLKKRVSHNNNVQGALKVLLNSGYGALASKYFRWFNLNHAEGITTAGQLSIRWVERDINRYLNKILKTKERDYVLAIDTDSLYVCFDDLVKQVYKDETNTQEIVSFLDKVGKTKIQDVIDESYRNLADYLNVFKQKMVMKRENIANLAIFIKKKRYIMNVYDSEGFRYEEPELKMMGIEAIRSSTPSVCREYIKNTLKLIMKGDEEATQRYVAKVKEVFFTLPFEAVAFPRSISFTGNSTNSDGSTSTRTYDDRNTIYKKGTPIQVKGALIYNHLVDEYKLQNDYEKISDGEKIKFAYLKKPNPIQQSVISAVNDIPKEFGLHKYIDYETQFEKGFIKPISSILEVIGWTAEKKSTLEDFFA